MQDIRIGALDAGTYYHRAALTDPEVARRLHRSCYLPELEATDLADLDTLIVTCRMPPRRIVRGMPLLERFLAAGHTLVIMGETSPEDWWPHHRFRQLPVNFTWWRTPGGASGLEFPYPSHPLFSHVPVEHCQWHYHGGFEASPAATTVIGCREGLAVLLDDRVTCAPGRVIATGLDPFYHHGAGFMPNATRFAHGLLGWLALGAPTSSVWSFAQAT